jgi:2-amino-4-hydroxy-6-hydroxymethyldihydropteridine diphosphokinase
MASITQRDVYVGVGSNIEARAHIGTALASLTALGLLRQVSPVYRTRAVAMGDADDFLNLVIRLAWSEDLSSLKAVLDDLEANAGRQPSPDSAWSARTLDLDILLDGTTVASYGSRPWQVPHPDIERFAYVAVPLADVAGHLAHPSNGRPIAVIAASLGRDGIEPCDWKVTTDAK